MKSKSTKTLGIISILFYIIAIGLMVFASIGSNDLEIDKALFNPTSKLAISLESFGQFVYWGMWGPIFTVLFLTRHGLNESLEIIGRVFPFIKPIKNTEAKAYKAFDFIVKNFFAVLFFVLGDIGYKKLIENVLNKFFDWSQAIYFILCAVVTAIAILIFSRIDKKTLYKLESLALAGIVLGICYKVVENCKEITARVRFREMIAWDNDITRVNSKDVTVSAGQLDKLTTRLDKAMIDKTDFSHFTKWFEMGKKTDYYDHSNSFPSGHTTYSCTMLLTFMLCNAFEKLKKVAPFALIISIAYTGIMAYSRMIAGAHYLSDVVGGAIIGYTLFLIVFAIYNKFCEKNIFPTKA